MAYRDQQINAERLFEASEAVLQAVRETVSAVKGGKKHPTPHPPDLMGSPKQPACLNHFTQGEVEEATAFLARLGYLTLPGTSK